MIACDVSPVAMFCYITLCCVCAACFVTLHYICHVMFSMHEQFACCVSSGAKHAAHFVSPHLSQLQLIALHCLLKRSFECKLQNVFVEIAKCICQNVQAAQQPQHKYAIWLSGLFQCTVSFKTLLEKLVSKHTMIVDTQISNINTKLACFSRLLIKCCMRLSNPTHKFVLIIDSCSESQDTSPSQLYHGCCVSKTTACFQ